jgi:hypothetical protein
MMPSCPNSSTKHVSAVALTTGQMIPSCPNCLTACQYHLSSGQCYGTDMLCRTIRTRWHHLSSSQCYGTDMLCRTIRTGWHHLSSYHRVLIVLQHVSAVTLTTGQMIPSCPNSLTTLLGHDGIICPVVNVTALTCCKTIRTRWYHLSSGQCYGTDML